LYRLDGIRIYRTLVGATEMNTNDQLFDIQILTTINRLRQAKLDHLSDILVLRALLRTDWGLTTFDALSTDKLTPEQLYILRYFSDSFGPRL